MDIKEGYYYLFYKFCKFFKALQVKILIKSRAAICVMALELFFLFSLINYAEYFLNKHFDLKFFSPEILIPLLILLFIKWRVLIKTDDWESYVQEFDHWSDQKNARGSWIVFIIVILSIANFIFSGYLSSPDKFRW